MKKKILYIGLALLLLLSGCSPREKDELGAPRSIDFNLIKNQVSKSFQKTEAYAEFLGKNLDPDPDGKVKLIVSSGLSDASSLEVEKIIREDNKLNIYIKHSFEGSDSKLAIQQAILELDTKYLLPLDRLEMNVIDNSQDSLQIKIGIEDAINKILSHFQLASNTTPTVNLFKEDDSLVWSISYDSIFDKSDPDLALISFSAKVDADSGEILSHSFEPIAKPLDSGQILHYIDDNFIVYRKIIKDKKTEEEKQELWIYNMGDGEKNLVFTSNHKIVNLQSSPDGKSISFIETRDEGSDLFIVDSENNNPYKLVLKDGLNPSLASWASDKKILVVEKLKDRSIIYSYDLKEASNKALAELDMDISSLASCGDNYLFIKNEADLTNKEIYISQDFKDMKMLGSGFSAKFLNEDFIIFLHDKESSSSNELNFYNIKKGKVENSIEANISNFQILNENKLSYVVKQDFYNDYIVYLCDPESERPVFLVKTMSNKAFYNENKNKIYLNINSPLENDINQLIYPIVIK